MAKKKDYILRSKAIKAVTGWDTEPTDEELELALMDIPAADVAPERRGRWEDVEHAPNGLLYATCSVCGKRQTVEAVNYCGTCGARMEASE